MPAVTQKVLGFALNVFVLSFLLVVRVVTVRGMTTGTPAVFKNVAGRVLKNLSPIPIEYAPSPRFGS